MKRGGPLKRNKRLSARKSPRKVIAQLPPSYSAPRRVVGHTLPSRNVSIAKPKAPVVASDVLRRSVAGWPCMVRAFGVCNHDPATVVLAHLPSDIAAGKSTDLAGVAACSDCHDCIDRRVIDEHFEQHRDEYLFRASVRTLSEWYRQGFLVIVDAAA